MVKDQEAVGVTLKDGTEVRAKVVLSNATPKVTFIDLLQKVSASSVSFNSEQVMSLSMNLANSVLLNVLSLQKLLPTDFYKEVSNIDYTSAATKINGTMS